MARILIVDTQTELRHQLVRLLEQAGHRATNVVLTDGSSTNLAKQAEAAGARVLMITGSRDRIIEFDASGQPYLSKPFPPEAFLRRVQEILSPS